MCIINYRRRFINFTIINSQKLILGILHFETNRRMSRFFTSLVEVNWFSRYIIQSMLNVNFFWQVIYELFLTVLVMYLLMNYYYFIFNHIHIKPVLYFMCCCSQDDLSKETVIYVIFLRQQQNHFTCTQSSLPFLRSKGIDPSNTICTCTYVCGCL